MQHILQIITTLEAGGAQVLVLDIAERLDRTRFRSTVAFLHRGGALAQAARARGIEVLDLSRGDRFDPLALPRLAWWLRRERVTLVHTHLVHAGVLGKLAARLAGIPAVTTRHYGVHEKRARFLYRLEDRLTRNAAATIAVSESVRQTLLRSGVAAEDRTCVIPNGIDLARFDPEQRLRSEGPEDPPAPHYRPGSVTSSAAKGGGLRIGAVGRLEPEKGMDVLIAACAILEQQGTGYSAEIVGEGSERARLAELVRSLGLGARVRFRGFVSRDALPHLLQGWDVVVQPSRKEAFGIAAVEAMAMAKPVVATRTEGIPEMLRNGDNGRLVEVDDPAGLAMVLSELEADPEQRVRLGQAARAAVEHRYSIEVTVAEIEKLYASLLVSPRR